MSRARTFTRVEMTDAVNLAAEHGFAVRFEPDGAMVIGPAGGAAAPQLDSGTETSAESELEKWKTKRGKAAGRAHH